MSGKTKLLTAGGGGVILQGASTPSDVTVTVPAGNTTLRDTGTKIAAADLNGNQSGDAPIFGCRAWVNFDGTRNASGGTDTANTNRFIRASGNVASVLRNGVGNYTITFTTAMPDANYAAVGYSGGSTGEVFSAIGATTYSTSAVQVRARTVTDTAQDPAIYCVQIFR